MFSLQLSVLHQFIRCNKTKIFLRNTNNSGRNGVKYKTHTPKTQRKITLEKMGEGGRRPTMSLDAFEILIFDSAREASNDVSSSVNWEYQGNFKLLFFLQKTFTHTKKHKTQISDFDPLKSFCAHKKMLPQIFCLLVCDLLVFFCL